jgi:hypothetical protein
MLTWGASIGGLMGPLSDYIEGRSPSITDMDKSLILVGVISVLYYDNKEAIEKSLSDPKFQKQMKHYHSTIEISVYNLYNRYNPFFYYIDTPVGSTTPKLMQITLFPIIPSISYNVKF